MPVNRTTTANIVRWSRRMRRRTSNPSIVGSATSSTIASGRSRNAHSRASTPSPNTMTPYPARSSTDRRRSATTGSSSTMSTLSAMPTPPFPATYFISPSAHPGGKLMALPGGSGVVLDCLEPSAGRGHGDGPPGSQPPGRDDRPTLGGIVQGHPASIHERIASTDLDVGALGEYLEGLDAETR